MKNDNLKNLTKHIGDINNYIIKEDLGEGNFGKIKLAIYIPTGDKYAVKILNKETIKQKMKNIAFKENEIIIRFRHINIINVFELIENSENYYIVMELCEKGELFDYIVSKKKLSEEEASMFFYQLINGVNYLHSKGISHRDLKPENLLLTNDKILKIIDFGLSHEFDENILLKTKCGSPSYAAPEIIKGKHYNGFKIDVWCCGIILYAMVCGYLPFEGETNKELFKSIIECNPQYPDFLSSNCKKLIKKILVVDFNKRISIDEIKKSEFYLKGKELCKKNYDIDLEELDKKSYIIKKEENIKNSPEKNIEKKEINIEKKEDINKNESKEILDNKKNDYENLFTKIELFNKQYYKELKNNKEKEKEKEKENKKINIEINDIIKKEINSLKEKEKNNILLFKDEEINSKNSNVNSQNKKDNINNIEASFRHKKSINSNSIGKHNNILNFKKLPLNNDKNKYNNILQTLKNSRNEDINKIFKLNQNNTNEMNSLNNDFQSIYSKRMNNNKKEYKLLETNSNKYENVINKYNNSNSLEKNNAPSLTLINKTNNTKNSRKKLILDNNNYSNNVSHLNSIKNEIIYYTDTNTKNNFDLDSQFKSISPNRVNKRIPPIKHKSKILNSNIYYNDFNININNLNINNTNDNFLNLNKIKEKNNIQNSDLIKININNINTNENIENYLQFKNKVRLKSDKRYNIRLNRVDNNLFKDNIIFNNSPRYEHISKKSPDNLMPNKHNHKLGNSIDLSNINNVRKSLKKKIYKNFYYNNESTSQNDNNRCNTINNYKNPNQNWNENNNSSNINSEKTPQKVIVKGHLFNNKNSNMNNIIRVNKYQLNEKSRLKKGHKYQVALKEFLNLIKSSNNKNKNNNNVDSSNKDFLPYL